MALNVFEFVILLVAVVLAYQLWGLTIKKKHAAQERQANDDVQTELRDLASRIEVLERIVTDSKYDLNRQFRTLDEEPEGKA